MPDEPTSYVSPDEEFPFVLDREETMNEPIETAEYFKCLYGQA